MVHPPADAIPPEAVPWQDHPQKAEDPVVVVQGLAQLRLARRDLDAARDFFVAFGLQVHEETAERVLLRGTDAGPVCVIVERAAEDAFAGSTFVVGTAEEVARLAAAADASPHDGPDGTWVDLTDPSGHPVRVAAELPVLDALPGRTPLDFNFGGRTPRTNATQRPPRAPASISRLGHFVLETTRFQAALRWYQQMLGLIVSDFLYLEELPERGPLMAFLRCDRGDQPADHHTLAMHLSMTNTLGHAAFEVTDLDAVAAGGEYLAEQGYHRVWGIGRHILGSQIFDYWRSPAGDLFEHYTDGDVFDASVPAGWDVMSAHGLHQWGPPVNRDFLGNRMRPELVMNALRALLAKDNEVDLAGIRALIQAMEP